MQASAFHCQQQFHHCSTSRCYHRCEQSDQGHSRLASMTSSHAMKENRQWNSRLEVELYAVVENKGQPPIGLGTRFGTAGCLINPTSRYLNANLHKGHDDAASRIV